MGRETKILLALLATLAGVFVGVLSMKLLVPRPPAGAGPDVHFDVAARHETVSPPTLSPPPTEATPGDRYRSGSSGFGAPAGEQTAAAVAGTEREYFAPRRDPFVTAAALEQPLPTADQSLETSAEGPVDPTNLPSGAAIPPPAAMPPSDRAAIEPLGLPPESPPAAVARSAAPSPPPVTYVATAGDSWWDLAERAYGDGRLYRALFAWNRVVDPRVSLTPGTRLEIPPRERLEAAWPRLMPPR